MSMRTNVMGWLRTRFPVDSQGLLRGLEEPVPGHLKRWWWCLGGMPAYLFLVQVITGIMLTFYYVPDPEQAYESVWKITHQVPLGWWVRSLHKWSSNLMIISLILHVLRVFFTGAYRKPRELNWMFGTLLLMVTLVFGFTGYSLVYEQLAYWGATVATNLAEAVPFVGEYLARFIRGGDTIGPNTLTRFFVFHIGILPSVIVVLMVLHILMVRTHGVTELHFRDETPEEQKTFRFFPDHVMTELMLGIGLLIVVSAVSIIFPPSLADRADPLVTPAHIKPEWYFYFAFYWLKLAGLTLSVLTMALAGLVFLLWPLLEVPINRFFKRDVSIVLGIIGFLGIMVLTILEAYAH